MEASTPTQWYVQCCNLKTHQLVVRNGEAQGGSQGNLQSTFSFGRDVTRRSRRVGFATAGVSSKESLSPPAPLARPELQTRVIVVFSHVKVKKCVLLIADLFR